MFDPDKSLAETVARVVNREIGSGNAMEEAHGRLFATGILDRFQAWATEELKRGTPLSSILGATGHLIVAYSAIPLTYSLATGHERELAKMMGKFFADELVALADAMVENLKEPRRVQD